MTTNILPKAFGISYHDLKRWDVSFFRQISWHWQKEYIMPLGNVLRRKKVEVERVKNTTELPIIEKISFGGMISVTDIEERKNYKGRLFWANKDDLIYSKIRVKQGSLAVIPDSISKLAVSAEYPVYSVSSRVVTSYLELVLRSKPFLDLLDGLAHGGSTKTRIPTEDFERLEIPIPPLEAQRAIVRRWREAQEVAQKTEEQAARALSEVERQVLADLGLKTPGLIEKPKFFTRYFHDFGRWSVSYNQARLTAIDIEHGKYASVRLDDILSMVQYGTSEKANNERKGTPVIRMNNIVNGVLDLSNLKHINLRMEDLQRLLLHDGDILFNRTNSKELVGKCAVFHEQGDYVFASYLIRIRTDDTKANPDYVSFIINSPIGRQQIDALSRQIIGQANINSKELESLLIPLPPLNVQKTILERVQSSRVQATQEREHAAHIRRAAEAEVEAMILGTKRVV